MKNIDLKEKLKSLEQEYDKLSNTFKKKTETLKEIRKEELEITLHIYEMEELYLLKIREEKKKILKSI